MNYWCNTCGCYKGAVGADECAVDGHAIVQAKDRDVKVSAAQPTTQGFNAIAAKSQAEREALRKEISELKKTIHEIHGTLDAVLHAADPVQAMKIWLPIALRDCRKAIGLPVEPVPAHEKAGFVHWALGERPKEWVPKVGDRVWVGGKTWSGPGTIIGFARDDPSVPWIKVDKDGCQWDARDLGSVRKLDKEPS